MEKIKNFKELELFEREIDVLKNIDNKHIPNYIDHTEEKIDGGSFYILVQEFVDGSNLYKLVKSGKNYKEKEILSLLKQILHIVSYIHNLHPPIIHRDINPKNIILDKTGKIHLVDFGAVGRGYKDTLAGAKSDTFVGTIGYMPQEQLFGKVHPGLDIYALGVTVLFLLTGREPWKFPVKNMKIDYHRFVNISEDLKYLIDKMINPDNTRRISSADKALSLINEIEDLIVEKPRVKIEISSEDESSTDWVNEALKEDTKRKTRNKIKKTEEKYKENKSLSRKKRKARKKFLKLQKQADQMPQRAELIKRADGTELKIKPYPVLRLMPKIIAEYYIFWIIIMVFGSTILVPFIVGFLEFIEDLGVNKEILTLLQIINVPVVILLSFIITHFVFLILVNNKDYTIHIRISKDNYCAVYKKNPKKSIYIGKKNKLTINIIKESYSLPNNLGSKHKSWNGIQINMPNLGKPVQRTGLTEKDTDIIKEFITLYM